MVLDVTENVDGMDVTENIDGMDVTEHFDSMDASLTQSGRNRATHYFIRVGTAMTGENTWQASSVVASVCWTHCNTQERSTGKTLATE